jgi:hypothetical protein
MFTNILVSNGSLEQITHRRGSRLYRNLFDEVTRRLTKEEYRQSVAIFSSWLVGERVD